MFNRLIWKWKEIIRWPLWFLLRFHSYDKFLMSVFQFTHFYHDLKYFTNLGMVYNHEILSIVYTFNWWTNIYIYRWMIAQK